jgi:hypothetical protein
MYQELYVILLRLVNGLHHILQTEDSSKKNLQILVILFILTGVNFTMGIS